MIRRAARLPWARLTSNSKVRLNTTPVGFNSRHLLSTLDRPEGRVVFWDNPTTWAKTRWDAFVKKSKVIIWKALTEPSPTVAGIQQLGALSTVISYAASDVLVLRVLAISGILLFNMIPNYYKLNYLNIGWGFAFLGFNVYRLAEIVRDRTTTADSLGFTPAELAVYEAKFQRHLTPRKFHSFLQCAEWREVEPGAVALDSAKECGLLVSGRCKVSKQGSTLLVAKPNMFLAVPNLDAVSNPPVSSPPGVSDSNGSSERGEISESVDKGSGSAVHQASARVLTHFSGILATSQAPPDEVAAPQAKDTSVENRMVDSDETFSATAAVAAVAAAFSAEAAAATATASTSPSPDLRPSSVQPLPSGFFGGLLSGFSNNTPVKEKTTLHDGHDNVETHTLAVHTAASASSATATIAATSDGPCKLLVWPLPALVSHFEEHEATGAAMLRVFNEALVENALARDHVLVVDKYKALLRRCLGSWSTSGTNGEEKTLPAGHKMALSNFRKAQNISDEDHHACLQSLGWTPEEYEWGAKKDSARASAALLKLSRGFGGATAGSKKAAVAAAPPTTSTSSSKRSSASSTSEKASTATPDLQSVPSEIAARTNTSGQSNTAVEVPTAAVAVEKYSAAYVSPSSTNTREEVAANRIKKVWEQRSKGIAEEKASSSERAGNGSVDEAFATASTTLPQSSSPSSTTSSEKTHQTFLNRRSVREVDNSSVAPLNESFIAKAEHQPPPLPPPQLPPNPLLTRSVTLGTPPSPSHKIPSRTQTQPPASSSHYVDPVVSKPSGLRSARSESEPTSARPASSTAAAMDLSQHHEHRGSLTMKAEQLWRRADNAALAMRNATLHSHFAEPAGPSLPSSSHAAAMTAAAAALQRNNSFQANISYAEMNQSSLRSRRNSHDGADDEENGWVYGSLHRQEKGGSSISGQGIFDSDINSLRRSRNFTAESSSTSSISAQNYPRGGSLRATGSNSGSLKGDINRWRGTNSRSLNLGRRDDNRHFGLHPSLHDAANSASDVSGTADNSSSSVNYTADDLAAVARYFAQDKRRRASEGHEAHPATTPPARAPTAPLSHDNCSSDKDIGRNSGLPSWEVLEQRRACLSSESMVSDASIGDTSSLHFEPTPLPPIWAVKVENGFGDSMYAPLAGLSKFDAAHQATMPELLSSRAPTPSSQMGNSPTRPAPSPLPPATTLTRPPPPSSSSSQAQSPSLELPSLSTSARRPSLGDIFSPLGHKDASPSTMHPSANHTNAPSSHRQSPDRTSQPSKASGTSSRSSYYRSAHDIFAQGPPSPMKAMQPPPPSLPPIYQLPQQLKVQQSAVAGRFQATAPPTKVAPVNSVMKLKRSNSF